MSNTPKKMRFAKSPESTLPDNQQCWTILVVDDEDEIHRVTKLALADFEFHGRGLKFLHAYTGREAVEMMRNNADVALILMDVVMETDHAGLDAVMAIRNELKNHFVRIVLRTGQPGQAPELEVVRDYDINDYKEKTELTKTRLYTVMRTGISLYRELVAMDQNRHGLEQVIEATSSVFKTQTMQDLQRGVLKQLTALLHANRDAMIVSTNAMAADMKEHELRVAVGSGRFEGAEGQSVTKVLDGTGLAQIRKAISNHQFELVDGHFAAYFMTRLGTEHVVYVSSDIEFAPADRRLIELLCRNVGIAYENLTLNLDIIDSQRRLITLLSAGVEERSSELHNHVQRVSHYSRRLGELLGLSPEDLDMLAVGAATHDLGKVAIPDAILNKPGRFTAEERALMETHAQIGEEMFAGQKGELLKSAATVVGGHHEHWDGKGYPRGLKGKDIPLFARITGIADVFDALSSKRCYKDIWPMDQIVDYMTNQRGKQFDPQLIDLFLENLDSFLAIRERYPSDIE